MLKKIWCVPVTTWFIPIATLAYRCSNLSSFTFVICFVSKVMPYFTSTVLCLLISGALVVSSVWSIGCSVVTFYRLRSNLGSTATYRCILQLQHIPNCAKLWYRTVWNIINTGTFPVPVYRASLGSAKCQPVTACFKMEKHLAFSPSAALKIRVLKWRFTVVYLPWLSSCNILTTILVDCRP